jgi:choice-of-anchor C domain-containing protein
VLAFGFVLGFGGTASAAPFQNGSFEIGTLTADPCNVALNAADTSFTGWTVSVGNIEYVTNGCWIAIDGTRSLDLVGNGSIGGIQQTFDTVAGAKYQVAFNLAGNPSPSFPRPSKPLTVTVSGITTKNYTFDTTGKTVASMGWVTKSFAFTANAPTTTIDFVTERRAVDVRWRGAR